MLNTLLEQNRTIILDGGMGSMLQRHSLPQNELPEEAALLHPEIITEIHRAYVEAGADIICANTFGANAKKLAHSRYCVEEVIEAGVACARAAAKDTATLVALDVGPLGELLEPAGTLGFEEAYGLFAQQVKAGAAAGADLIMIETIADLYEAKAAVLAAKENCGLPVMISMTFERDGRTFSGVPVEAAAATLSPLGISAMGINCSLSPAEILPLFRRLSAAATLPVYVKANAGLPDPATGEYTVGPERFLEQMQAYEETGVSMVGGCCGTTPDTIRLLAGYFKAKAPARRQVARKSQVCSSTRVAVIDHVTPIGERINPTGKKRLQQALQNGDMGYLQTQAVLQQNDGAEILDVNVGAPGVDEVALLPQAVKAVQAVTDLPLQLDSNNPAALEAALRVYNGKAIVNSTTGEREKLDAVLPLCKKYGAAVIGLTLDEQGIPATAEGRLAVAKRILQTAGEYGIPAEDVYIDCLVLTVSAEPEAAGATLAATRMVKEQLGLKTLLGVSNVSFGLPNRPLVNATFLTMALEAGLDLPILNPALEGMMGAIAAHNLLRGKDRDAKGYVARYGGDNAAPQAAPPTGGAMPLDAAIRQGLKEEAANAARALLAGENPDGLALVDAYLIPALDEVGKGYESGKLFLPQLLASAGAAQATFEVIRERMGTGGSDGPPVVLATVKGDVHDIGKNIAKVLLENYGYTVTDLGRDIAPERVVEAVKATGARLVGLSALMTTTLPAMQDTIKALRQQQPDCKILVGGAVLTAEYAAAIGADYYARDGLDDVHAAKEIYGE